MAWNRHTISLAVLMVVTGSLNTLTTKWADSLQATGADGKVRPFNHPFLQSTTMFFGEALCLVAFKVACWIQTYKRRRSSEGPLGRGPPRTGGSAGSGATPLNIYVNPLASGNQEFSPWIFLPPAMCDMVATSLMYIGLNLTFASSFQMLRGSVIVFVALLSIAFLEREITTKQWGGIVSIVLGLFLVGLADFFQKGSSGDINGILTGDLLIIMAQIITAIQMVYEEKYVNTRDINPLQAVGWEGIFGYFVLGFLLIPVFNYIHVPPPFSNNASSTLEDVSDAFVQMIHNKLIIVALVGTVVSIAFFNFAGISMTKQQSATSRMVLDSVRTLIIWAVSLGLKWQEFHLMQVGGFLLLVSGMAIYNDLISSIPWGRCFGLRRSQYNEEPLIDPPSEEPEV